MCGVSVDVWGECACVGWGGMGMLSVCLCVYLLLCGEGAKKKCQLTVFTS